MKVRTTCVELKSTCKCFYSAVSPFFFFYPYPITGNFKSGADTVVKYEKNIFPRSAWIWVEIKDIFKVLTLITHNYISTLGRNLTVES